MHGSALVIGIAGAAFLAAGYAPAAVDKSTRAVEGIVAAEVSAKGDRLSVLPGAAERIGISAMEVAGQAVILRSAEGAVVFASDARSNTTIIAKNVNVPAVILPDAAMGQVAYHAPASPTPALRSPSESSDGRDRPSAKQRKPRTIGCESALSPLVKGSSASLPSKCLA